MTEPQVWTLIGVFAAALFGMLTLMSTMFVRIVRTEIGSVRTEIEGLRREMQTEFGSVRTEIRHLDRDVQSIARRVFGDDDAA